MKSFRTLVFRYDFFDTLGRSSLAKQECGKALLSASSSILSATAALFGFTFLSALFSGVSFQNVLSSFSWLHAIFAAVGFCLAMACSWFFRSAGMNLLDEVAREKSRKPFRTNFRKRH
jgi:ABC-type uncharacterized transport system YnjBCD permease subunit